jgi:thrombospondin type 3 repeat protein
MNSSIRLLALLFMLTFSVSATAQNPQPEMSACDVLNAGLGSLDVDRDGLENCKDNCMFDANPDQKDTDRNGIGDVCEWREQQRKAWEESGRELRRQAREPVDLSQLIAKSSDVALGRLTNERWRTEDGILVIKVEVIRRFKDSTDLRYQRYERPMWILVPYGGPLELVDELLLFLRNEKAKEWRKPAIWPEPLRVGSAPEAMSYFSYELSDLKYGVLGVSSARVDQIERIVKAQTPAPRSQKQSQ